MELASIWFFIWGLLWAIYFITDGFDLGIGILLPFLGKKEEERRTMLRAMGPLWNGNEVWLITAGGVTFAAFPMLYAVMFSSLYSALMLVLFGLIIRGVCVDLRAKANTNAWRRISDAGIFLGSLLPGILLGAAFANIFRGLPIDKEGIFHGSILTLLNPYGLLGGVLFLMFFLLHGSIWLSIKTQGELRVKAAATSAGLWVALLIAAVVFLISSAFATTLYDNYISRPGLGVVILIAVASILAIRFFLAKKAYWKAWFSCAISILASTFFGVIGLFPAMFPSSLNREWSLTAFNASSSPLTLKIMLIVAIIFVPIVLAYQIWAYGLFRHPVTEKEMASEDSY
ncbi:MAG: cytochrome d ubiquinol oxidase subunit II [Deltaproteobacteria bacterium CG_4_8_14_3_um_filter_51_11]|nr:cytochrome d ubiquinol oxidase subunit II [bacterium]OIP38948.1 MAG: cytochrome d ubiquinol oxidase subunit II [Desulfobacteraceae bacterium CG2_30_51_40]PIP47738.1 MAG: cytochrome d ubiquinol oxidase subunit II [Deltaproteobacteria bacterium CG23_combo_of_CG06-09_8_20_14_all_51_20]PIW01192.1 MAG: cytochrome d ubiquinol oxidase subunit II [Deltaproteobacteria bacterium CG17_big_fil_post_rev_8_21_14_2_50_51_6]PIX19794.1 MAG: cytochrome d ubiquinol oxidase subunit II [Deltaproteobacteria bacte